VDTPIKYQDARTYGTEAKALLVRTLSYLFQHESQLEICFGHSWGHFWTCLDIFGLSDSCGGFGLQIHDPSFSSLNA
jgi:hypothetical protein